MNNPSTTGGKYNTSLGGDMSEGNRVVFETTEEKILRELEKINKTLEKILNKD